jgi:hypothetical protein
MVLLMNGRASGFLQRFAARLQEHEIPEVGWATTVLLPRGVRARAYERAEAVTIVVTERRGVAAARLDLSTREVAISAKGASIVRLSRLRRIALDFVADRNAADHRNGIGTRGVPPIFDVHDSQTWTEMQLFAEVTDSDWYPPEPVDRGSDGWAAFYDTAHRFNDRFTSRDAAATAPHPTPPRGGR